MTEQAILKLSRADMQAKERVESCLIEANEILRSLAAERKRQKSQRRGNIVAEIKGILQEA